MENRTKIGILFAMFPLVQLHRVFFNHSCVIVLITIKCININSIKVPFFVKKWNSSNFIWLILIKKKDLVSKESPISQGIRRPPVMIIYVIFRFYMIARSRTSDFSHKYKSSAFKAFAQILLLKLGVSSTNTGKDLLLLAPFYRLGYWSREIRWFE